MKKPRKPKRALPNIAAVQITDGALSICLDFAKLDDGALEEIVKVAKRQLERQTPTRNLEAAFDARCRDALATFKESPGQFAEATRAIAAERPQLTVVEFFDRAMRGARP